MESKARKISFLCHFSLCSSIAKVLFLEYEAVSAYFITRFGKIFAHVDSERLMNDLYKPELKMKQTRILVIFLKFWLLKKT